MTAGGDLSDAEWAAIAPLLPPGRGRRGRPPARDNRTVVDALLWLARAEAGWRSLPERYGPWNSVWRRVSRWGDAGLLDALPAALAASALDADRQAAIRAAVLRCRRGGALCCRDRGPPGPAAPGDRRQERRPDDKPARRGQPPKLPVECRPYCGRKPRPRVLPGLRLRESYIRRSQSRQ